MNVPVKSLAAGLILALATVVPAQTTKRQGTVSVTLHEPVVDYHGAAGPVDPKQRIEIQYTAHMAFGLVVDDRIQLCCGAGAITTLFKVDGAVVVPNLPRFVKKGALTKRTSRSIKATMDV